MLISGSTRVAAVIGDPVAHSLSPAIHNAAFRALELDWVYVALPVSSGHGGDAVEAMRTLDLAGLSVTMPHKQAVAEAVDEPTAVVELLGACNCVFRRGDRLVGDNTDGAGFIRSLADAEIDVGGRTVAVIGAGGAGRAVIAALGQEGAARIAVVNRDPGRQEEAVALSPVASAEPIDVVADCDLIVNTTPVGMGAADDDRVSLPVPADLIQPRHVVVDIVYQPIRTPLLRVAETRGATTVGGIGMLVHQAAVAFEHWTARTAPIPAMRTAIDQTLGVPITRSRPGPH